MTEEPKLAIALYQPDIPGNTGTLLRLAACIGAHIHVIGPAGFDMSDRALRRAGMDYVELASLTHHVNWPAFDVWRRGDNRRVVLLTTKAQTPYTDVTYQPSDILLFGRESAGAPDHVHDAADLRLTIPMAAGARSLNLALAAAMVAGETLRQYRSR